MLINSGSDFAKKYMQINDLYIRDKDGNILQEESKKIEDGIAKLYNQLFQYRHSGNLLATLLIMNMLA